MPRGLLIFRLDGRVAIVTGAASGIGAATAERLAEAGADLILGWYSGDPHDVGPVARVVEERGRRSVVVEADVAESPAVERLVAGAIEHFGRLDVVVANAAIARDVPASELDDERWARLLDVDLAGVFRCFRAALPHMQTAGWGGSSRRARSPGPFRAGRGTSTTRPRKPESSGSCARSPSRLVRTGSR